MAMVFKEGHLNQSQEAEIIKVKIRDVIVPPIGGFPPLEPKSLKSKNNFLRKIFEKIYIFFCLNGSWTHTKIYKTNLSNRKGFYIEYNNYLKSLYDFPPL